MDMFLNWTMILRLENRDKFDRICLVFFSKSMNYKKEFQTINVTDKEQCIMRKQKLCL